MPEALNLITVRDAAIRLEYTVQHTRLLIRRGKLSAVKYGRDWLIPADSLKLLRRADRSQANKASQEI